MGEEQCSFALFCNFEFYFLIFNFVFAAKTESRYFRVKGPFSPAAIFSQVGNYIVNDLAW